MAVYPESINLEVCIAYRSSTPEWVEITKDAILDQKASYGIFGDKPTDRVASTGSFEFILRNDSSAIWGENCYLPFSPNFVNFKIGAAFRVKISYDGQTYVKFFGHIARIEVDSTSLKTSRLKITALDWFDYAAVHAVNLPSVDYNKRIDEVAQTIVSAMPIQPLSTQYYQGADVFPTVFDSVSANTKATSELAKIAISEMGYIYIKRDKTNGEQFVVESRHTRSLNKDLPKLPVGNPFSGHVLLEIGDSLLLEDGGYLLLDETQDSWINSGVVSVGVSYGDNLLNRIRVSVYPRQVDTIEKVLFSLSSPISLAVGETKVFKGTFRDPSGGSSKVNGIDMVVPVAFTDYRMYTNPNGTGTEITADLDVVAQYGAEGVEYTLTNNSLMTGYVTKLQARGKGVYLYDQIEYKASDTPSISTYGEYPLKVDMKYQADTTTAVAVAKNLLQQNKEPKLVLNKISFLANQSDLLLQAFLNLDVGDLVYLADPSAGIDGYFHIQAVEYILSPGGIIQFSWDVLDALSSSGSYWELGISGKSELNTTTILGF